MAIDAPGELCVPPASQGGLGQKGAGICSRPQSWAVDGVLNSK